VKNLLTIALTFIAAALISCGPTKSTETSTGKYSPEKRFADAKAAYDKEDWLVATSIFDEVRLQAPTSEFAAEAAFLEGMCRYKSETYISAAVDFRAVRRNYPSSEFADRAQFMVAECYYGLSPRAELDQTYTGYAITEYQTFLRDCPKASKALQDSATARIAELRNKQGAKVLLSAELYIKLVDRKSALKYFERVLDQFYDTPSATEAELRIAEVQYSRKKMREAADALDAFDQKFLQSASQSQRERAMKLRQQISLK
jgi:outer membrane assembly lipoprotein YfiO